MYAKEPYSAVNKLFWLNVLDDLSDIYLSPNYFPTRLNTKSLIYSMADAQVPCRGFMGKFVPRSRKM